MALLSLGIQDLLILNHNTSIIPFYQISKHSLPRPKRFASSEEGQARAI